MYKKKTSDTKEPKEKRVQVNKWITCSTTQHGFLHLWDFGVCQALTATPGPVNRFGAAGVCWLIHRALRAESPFPALRFILLSLLKIWHWAGMLIKTVLTWCCWPFIVFPPTKSQVSGKVSTCRRWSRRSEPELGTCTGNKLGISS